LATSTRFTRNPQDDFILQQRAHQEQPKHLFQLIGALGSKIESAVEIVEKNSSSKSVEPLQSAPSRKEKKEAAARIATFQQGSEREEEASDTEDDPMLGTGIGDDYVSHALYRDIIAEGFNKKSPSMSAPNKPAYISIDDSVTRTLTASKISAKAPEYSITIANAFVVSVTRAALDNALGANTEGDNALAFNLSTRTSQQQHGRDRGHV
jgi:hypothetical protein